MAIISGSTAIDWSTISLDPTRFDDAIVQFEERFEQIDYALETGQFSVTKASPTFASFELNAGGTLALSGSGLNTWAPVIKVVQYVNSATGEAVRLTGVLDGRGVSDSVSSIKVSVPGVQVSFSGSFLVSNSSGDVSGTARSTTLRYEDGTSITFKGRFPVSASGDGTVDLAGTVTEIRVVSGASAITMTGLAVPAAAFESIDSVDDIFAVVGADSPGNDIIKYANTSPVGMTLRGGAGNDTITLTGPNADELHGDSGNDVLNGGGGADSLYGGTGNDIYIYDGTADSFHESAGEGTDQVRASASFTLPDEIENLLLTGRANIDGTGNALANTLVGNGGSNWLRGDAGDDVLAGNAGHDTLDGGAGNDRMNGGAGNDTYEVDAPGDVVRETLVGAAGGTDTVRATISYTLGANVEKLVLLGDADLSGTGNALANQITGNEGANLLDGRAGADSLIGGAGDDTYVVDNARDKIVELAGEGDDTVRASISYSLEGKELENVVLTGKAAINTTGNEKNNVLTGNSGANRLDGKAGADRMEGAAGNDVYRVDDAGDTAIEAIAGGIDRVESSVDFVLGDHVENLTLVGAGDLAGTGNGLSNVLIGNSGSNWLRGEAGNDVLTGKAGNDTLDGGEDNDRMSGGAGNDTYQVDAPGDVVSETLTGAAGGIDTVRATISYALGANVENLVLLGGAENGTGNALANQITGNDGANRIAGGRGNDVLTGGPGPDSFVFNTPPHATRNADHVTDFTSGTDLILLENAVFTGLGRATGPLNPAAFVSGAGPTGGQDATDRIVYDTATGQLYYDANGSAAGGATLFATLDGSPALSASDFLVT